GIDQERVVVGTTLRPAAAHLQRPAVLALCLDLLDNPRQRTIHLGVDFLPLRSPGRLLLCFVLLLRDEARPEQRRQHGSNQDSRQAGSLPVVPVFRPPLSLIREGTFSRPARATPHPPHPPAASGVLPSWNVPAGRAGGRLAVRDGSTTAVNQ